MGIEAVVFDIGNVLIEWQPERFYDAEFGEQRRRALFKDVDLHAMNDRVDLGEGFQDVIYETADQYPEYRNEIRLWHDKWIEMASPDIPHSVKLLRALRAKGIPVFALTNFGVESFAYAQTQYKFLTEFDRFYVSGQLKLAKPDAAIYAHVEHDSALAGSRLLFADDRSDNIDAAKKRGWHTHQFVSPAGWAKTLVAYGLLTKDEAMA